MKFTHIGHVWRTFDQLQDIYVCLEGDSVGKIVGPSCGDTFDCNNLPTDIHFEDNPFQEELSGIEGSYDPDSLKFYEVRYIWQADPHNYCTEITAVTSAQDLNAQYVDGQSTFSI